jgi:hypothetical protein
MYEASPGYADNSKVSNGYYDHGSDDDNVDDDAGGDVNSKSEK